MCVKAYSRYKFVCFPIDKAFRRDTCILRDAGTLGDAGILGDACISDIWLYGRRDSRLRENRLQALCRKQGRLTCQRHKKNKMNCTEYKTVKGSCIFSQYRLHRVSPHLSIGTNNTVPILKIESLLRLLILQRVSTLMPYLREIAHKVSPCFTV